MSLRAIYVIKGFFASAYGPAVCGILLTALVGGLVNIWVQKTISTREENFEIYKRNLNQAEIALDQTTNIIKQRLFNLERVAWDFQRDKIAASNKDWLAYRQILKKWNTYDMVYTNQLRIYYGDQLAKLFWQGRINKPDNNSLYKKFYQSHLKLLTWRDCLQKVCRGSQPCRAHTLCHKSQLSTMNAINQLNQSSQQFVNVMYHQYVSQYLHRKLVSEQGIRS